MAKLRIKARSGENLSDILPSLFSRHRAEKRLRITNYALLGMFIFFNLLLIYKIFQEGTIPGFHSLPQWHVNIEKIQCKSHIFKASRGNNYSYFDLVIDSWGFRFVASDIKPGLCKRLAKSLALGEDVQITHYAGLIYELRYQDDIIIPYKDLKSSIR